jgi:hypothetical protein
MTEFSDRERAFEKKFELDEELKFKIISRTMHLFGMWAAQQMKLNAGDASAYAQHIVSETMTKAGRDHVIERVEKDFSDKGIAIGRHRVEKEIDEFFLAARKQLAE